MEDGVFESNIFVITNYKGNYYMSHKRISLANLVETPKLASM